MNQKSDDCLFDLNPRENQQILKIAWKDLTKKAPLSLGCCKSDVKIEEIYDCHAFFKDHDLKITAFPLHALELSS